VGLAPVNSRLQIGLISGILILLGVGLTLYKSISLGFPLFPDEYSDVWTIESKVNFKPSDGPVDVSLKLPADTAGWVIIDEHFVSSGFGFAIKEDGGVRRANWTRQSLARPSTLYYKLQAFRPRASALKDIPVPTISTPDLEPDQAVAVARLVANIREMSVDAESFAIQLVTQFNQQTPGPDVKYLLGTNEGNPLAVIRTVLGEAGIPSQLLRGIELEDGRRRQTLSSLVEFHDGSSWQVIDPLTARMGIPDSFFVWQRGPGAVLNLSGGKDSSLEFALVSNSMPARAIAGMEQRAQKFALLDFSIYALPVEEQGVFKGLLLIPVAALVVVLMRLIVGLKTSGTFMPILIALAFIQTSLFWGLAIFVTLVGIGLWIRGWLSHMNLLLVSRVSAVVIVVILLMASVAIISYKMGLDQILTVTFFPTIILAWTIERMSILWEEEGPHEVLVQGGGSLLVATLAYLAMSNPLVAHLTFNFPELTLSLLGIILLLGKYTGYRLFELYRFRDLRNSP
jgi:hypothetical protein